MVSGLMLKSLIRVELGFVCDVRQWSDFFLFFFCRSLLSFPRRIFLAPLSQIGRAHSAGLFPSVALCSALFARVPVPCRSDDRGFVT